MAIPYQTAGTIISRAALQLGLGAVPDAFGSTDVNVAQLREFLNVAGDELMHLNDWTHLKREFAFTTIANQSIYALPDDYHNMVDQTGWNRTTRMPLGGPLSSQQWQFLKARAVGVIFNVLFRLNPLELELFPNNVQPGVTVALEYLSRWWVRSAASTTVDAAGVPLGDTDVCAANGDLVLFDPVMVLRFVKLMFLQAKGFDTEKAERDFRLRFDYEVGRSDGAPTVSLNRGRSGARLLDGTNIPITGYGDAFGGGGGAGVAGVNDGMFDGSF